ncbi:voltage-dependent calcium channel gamma-6 subunit [Physeter macrocephalus]|uniref:Voltage-dependent calcium channel gamma-6 subunit n=1 Tax=Physeter macrocephalus TaxID=9755 RepID=A0A455AZW6_PHYMC|nr:voltage-dependent calcium channel gamma-6 subunit [Physeter catodon]XP_028342082.1 voltage-dependent calcium channel gamma-6 subunit [Physeter catodon]XP_028342083.1 voltage-dependent calcium channel gamma-6 subunit [Physeter catodon]XP_054939277.1 voltage-dependent calcium channel gamma-6 subunit [Physeter catodon]|eukprot:XP_028342081.1 voltage-dependent calcium channel gamma-6 subunit [Physeter catodon]
MMWSNFFMHEEDRRLGAVGRRRAHGARKARMTPEHEGKITLALLLASVGATLAVLAVGTEFWVELNTYRDNGSAVCDAAHLGLWKVCTKRLWQADVPAGRDTCGPAELPGEANCTYFKFFTTGEDAHIFQRTTKKEVNLAAAVIAVLGLAVMALGCLCVIMVLSKGAAFLLRVGAICFGLSDIKLPSSALPPSQPGEFSGPYMVKLGLSWRNGKEQKGGLLLLVSLEVFRHSVQALLQRVGPEPPPAPALTYEYSWSLGCGLGAGLVLILGSGFFLQLTLPPWPWGSLCPKWGHRAT